MKKITKRTKTERQQAKAEALRKKAEKIEAAAAAPKSNSKKSVKVSEIAQWLIAIVIAIALVGILIMLMTMHFGRQNNELPEGTTTDIGAVDTVPGGNEVPNDTSADTDPAPSFEREKFTESVVEIARDLKADEEDLLNVHMFVENIPTTKLQELVGKYGEFSVQKAIAEFLVFVPEIKMYNFIDTNGLSYNPNAVNDWYNALDAAEAEYKAATGGKNPEGSFMSLEGYDTYKEDREIMKSLILKSGDTALLKWYEVKTSTYDRMVLEQRHTKAAETYREEVKLELVEKLEGSVKLLELQLENKVNGTDVDTLEYAEVYEKFIISNYLLVAAN